MKYKVTTERRSSGMTIGAEWHDLPPDSFAEAGTGVNTCILKVTNH
jgi:hypothetical protein